MNKSEESIDEVVQRDSFEDVLASLEHYKQAADGLRDVVLANLAMTSEIPAETFDEKKRIRFLMDRFAECGLNNSSRDEVGNGQAILPGTDGNNNILLLAHADTVFPETVDHTVSVNSDCVVGPGVADNSLGLAVLETLPTLLQRLNIQLKSNLILMGGVKSLGRGDLAGIKFFLEHNALPISSAICIEGVPLGRLGIDSIGMIRGEIRCRIPDEYDWTRFEAVGAILTMNDVMNELTAITMPSKPRTSIMLGEIRGGTSFNKNATSALLRFEVRSESAEQVQRMERKIKSIVDEIAFKTKSEVTLDILARREPGGIPFGHPMAHCARTILEQLDVDVRISPSTSELCAFIDHGIPAVTVGITDGAHLNELDETVYLKRMSIGLAQLIGLIVAADGEFCNECK